jgi:hypothetical protein
MPVVHLSPQEMESFADSARQDPAVAKLQEITVDYATSKGGLVLEFWRLHMGRFFGVPIMMGIDDAAGRLDQPVSTIRRLHRESQEEISKLWMATPEYRASEFAEP